MDVFECKFDELHIDQEQNNRVRIDPSSCKSLAKSILEKGLLTPVVVRIATEEDKTDKKFILVAGFRRCVAMKYLLGRESVPANLRSETVKDDDNDLNLIENIERKNLSLIEEAQAIKRLYKEFNITEIADKLNRSHRWVERRLKFLRLPEDIQTMMDNGILKLGEIDKLIKLPAWKARNQARAIAEGRVKDVKKQVKRNKQPIATALERMMDYLISRENPEKLKVPLITLMWAKKETSTEKFFEKIGLSQEEALEFDQAQRV